MCFIIAVLFELSLHVTDRSSYFKTSHKEPVDSVRTSISEVLRQALVTRAQQLFSLPCSWLVTKGNAVFPLQCGPVFHRMLSVFMFLTVFFTHLSVQYTIDLTAVCLIVICTHQPSDDRETSANCDGPDEKGRETESSNASHTAGDNHHDSAVKPFAVGVQCSVK